MGLWHGASWNFVFWGIWNFILIFFFRIINKFFFLYENKISKIVSWFIFLQLIMISWIFFRSESLLVSFQMLDNFFSINKWTFLSLKENIYIITALVTIFYLMTPSFIKIFNILKLKSKIISEVITISSLTIALILILIYNQELNQFIYFQF
tara:strand:- start:208 stop:663 length:456 start_codon:yes stop_codon:yes gene_type:complete